jgi:hypothetical protein
MIRRFTGDIWYLNIIRKIGSLVKTVFAEDLAASYNSYGMVLILVPCSSLMRFEHLKHHIEDADSPRGMLRYFYPSHQIR